MLDTGMGWWFPMKTGCYDVTIVEVAISCSFS